MTDGFPRLLVATEFAPNASGGGPAVVRQMLRDWPVENLFWWSCLPDLEPHFRQSVAGHRVAAIPRRLYPHRRLRHLKSSLLETFWSRWAAPHLRRTLDLFKPEVIWVIPHSWAILPLAAELMRGRIPFHTTVQDYMDANSSVWRMGAARCSRLVARAERLYARATTRDATSHPMIADLRGRTGCEAAQMLHAGLEEKDFTRLSQKQETPGAATDEIRIAYAGTIIVEREFALFVEALAALRSQLPGPVKLEFFGGDAYRSRPWFDPSWMHENGNLPEPALTQGLASCTWGFSPMALSDDDPRYNRFSFPTKFISYLAAGLPVITLGHPESSIIQMARTYRVGPCIGSGENDALRRELSLALSIRQPWKEFGPEILRCTRAEFDAGRMRGILYECFRTCAGRT